MLTTHHSMNYLARGVMYRDANPARPNGQHQTLKECKPNGNQRKATPPLWQAFRLDLKCLGFQGA